MMVLSGQNRSTVSCQRQIDAIKEEQTERKIEIDVGFVFQLLRKYIYICRTEHKHKWYKSTYIIDIKIQESLSVVRMYILNFK